MMALKPKNKDNAVSEIIATVPEDSPNGDNSLQTQKTISKTSGEVASDKQSSLTPKGKPEVLDLKIDDSNINLDELEKKLSAVANDLYENAKVLEDDGQALDLDINKFESQPGVSAGKAVPVSDDMSTIPAELTNVADFVQAANDDPEDPLLDSSLIYALQKKPSSLTGRVCATLGLAWFVGCIYYGYINLNSSILGITSIADFFASSMLILLTITAVLPILLLWAFASMIRSVQEMRNITHSMTKGAIRLLQPESSAIHSISALSQIVRQEVAAIDNGVERAVARTSELEHMVQNEITNLERSCADSEVKLCGLISELSSERENIEGHAKKLRESITKAHSGLTEELDVASWHIQNIVSQASNQITQSISERSSSISTSFLAMEKNLEEKISEAESGAQERLSASGMAFNESVAIKTSEFVNHIKSAGDAMSNMLDMHSEQINTKNNGIAKKFEDAIILRSTEFAKCVEETGDALDSTLEARISTIDSVLDSKGMTLVEHLGVRTEELDKILNGRAIDIKKSIDNGMNEVITTFDKKRKSLDDSLAKRSDELLNALSANVQNLDTIMAQRTDSVSKTITGIAVTIDDQATEFEQSLSNHVDDIVLRLSNRTSELQNAAGKIEADIDRCTENVNDRAITYTVELSEAFNQSQIQIMQAIQSGHDLAAGKLDQKLGQTVEGLDNKAAQLSELFSEHMGQINKSMENNLVENQRSLDTKAVVFKNLLDDRSIRMSNILTEHSQKLSQQTSAVGAELSECYTEFSTIVNEKTVPMLKSIQQSSGQITQGLTETQHVFKENAAGLKSFLDDRSIRMSNMLKEHSQKLSQQTGIIGEELSKRSIEFSNIIADQTIPVLESIRQSRDGMTQSLNDTSIELDAKAADVIDKLSSSNQILHTLLDRSEKKMNITQSSLAQQLSSMTETFNRASTDLDVSGKWVKDLQTEMKETAAELLANMDSTAMQLNVQSGALVEAAKQVDTSQNKFSTTLSSRHKLLDELSSGLLHRSDEIETSMSALAITVNRMFEEINSKSKEFGGAIGTEVSTAINDAATRFKDATESMKTAAKDVSAQLEKTRGQMRRGILELPDETRQSADSMRRVVTDQIKALKDLSDIVANSGQALDATAAVQKFHTNSTPSSHQNITQPADSHSLKILGTTQPTHAAPEAIFQKKPATQTPGRSLQKEKNGSSWVSDLLRRASENEPSSTTSSPTPPHQPGNYLSQNIAETFNKLSINIAKAIDHEASAKLWDHYQAGEKDIFTRRLYTIKSQKTFDEIQRKYQDNQNFKNTVDQYIAGFERLLSDIAQKDPDNIRGQTYLASDIGKVYIMLTHALQRFKS